MNGTERSSAGNSPIAVQPARTTPIDGPEEHGFPIPPNVTLSVHADTSLRCTVWNATSQPPYVSVRLGDDLTLFLDMPSLQRLRVFLDDSQRALAATTEPVPA
jgi:hypothetical protein